MTTLDDEKLALLDEAADHPEPTGRSEGDDVVAAGPLVRPYYRNVAAEDVTERTSEDLYGALVSHLDLARSRPQGTARVRVLTPGPDDGWSAGGHSVVEVVTDDMPFLVDSLTMELVRQDLEVRVVVHPQMDVLRDITGGLRSVTGVEDGSVAPEGDSIRESWMHVEVSRVSDRDDAAEIEEALQRVLGDVRVAVEDWPKMNAMVREIVDGLASDPPPLSGSEITQGQDLLRWLASDHFTFLGFREYRLEVVDGRRGAAGAAGHRARDPALRPGHVLLVRQAPGRGPGQGAREVAAGARQGQLTGDRPPVRPTSTTSAPRPSTSPARSWGSGGSSGCSPAPPTPSR